MNTTKERRTAPAGRKEDAIMATAKKLYQMERGRMERQLKQAQDIVERIDGQCYDGFKGEAMVKVMESYNRAQDKVREIEEAIEDLDLEWESQKLDGPLSQLASGNID